MRRRTFTSLKNHGSTILSHSSTATRTLRPTWRTWAEGWTSSKAVYRDREQSAELAERAGLSPSLKKSRETKGFRADDWALCRPLLCLCIELTSTHSMTVGSERHKDRDRSRSNQEKTWLAEFLIITADRSAKIGCKLEMISL
jgi:hypothetical protein